MTETLQERFTKRVEEGRARKAAAFTEQPILEPEISAADTDLVPDGTPELFKEDLEMDKVIEVIKGTGFPNLYNRWNLKGGTCTVRPGQRESIKFRCPWPDHNDEHASAWTTTDKPVFNCGHPGCRGGDWMDVAAIKFGYPDYKTDGNSFHELRRAIAEDFGYKFYTTPGSKALQIVEPEPEPPEQTAPPTEPSTATVTSISQAPSSQMTEPDDIDYSLIREINWKEVVPAGTFLYDYMLACTNDSAPEMYHFWNGLLALGFAVGRSVALKDQKPVYSNLFVCLMGRSGLGKSNSMGHLKTLLREALPYTPGDPLCLGVKPIRGAGSGEELIAQFMNPEYDPTNPKQVLAYREVRGLVLYGELTGLIGRADRPGQGVLKDTVMELLDCEAVLGTSSRTKGSVEAHFPFGSILTSTQPKIIKDLLRTADQHSGFVNRIKLVYGTPKFQELFDETVIDLSAAATQLKLIHGWSGAVKQTHDGLVRHAPDFRSAIRDAWEGKYKAIKEKSSRTDDMLGRLDLDFKRVCLLLGINEHKVELDADIVARAIPIMDYLIDCSSLGAESIGETVEGELFKRITQVVDAFNKAKKTPTASEIHQKVKHNKKFTLKMVHDTLWQMENMGILVAQVTSDSQKRGPKTKRYERGR